MNYWIKSYPQKAKWSEELGGGWHTRLVLASGTLAPPCFHSFWSELACWWEKCFCKITPAVAKDVEEDGTRKMEGKHNFLNVGKPTRTPLVPSERWQWRSHSITIKVGRYCSSWRRRRHWHDWRGADLWTYERRLCWLCSDQRPMTGLGRPTSVYKVVNYHTKTSKALPSIQLIWIYCPDRWCTVDYSMITAINGRNAQLIRAGTHFNCVHSRRLQLTWSLPQNK